MMRALAGQVLIYRQLHPYRVGLQCFAVFARFSNWLGELSWALVIAPAAVSFAFGGSATSCAGSAFDVAKIGSTRSRRAVPPIYNIAAEAWPPDRAPGHGRAGGPLAARTSAVGQLSPRHHGPARAAKCASTCRDAEVARPDSCEQLPGRNGRSTAPVRTADPLGRLYRARFAAEQKSA